MVLVILCMDMMDGAYVSKVKFIGMDVAHQHAELCRNIMIITETPVFYGCDISKHHETGWDNSTPYGFPNFWLDRAKVN